MNTSPKIASPLATLLLMGLMIPSAHAATTFTSLHTFANTTTDGSEPQAGLVQATDGNLYGTTHGGGERGFGTVFQITTSGTLATIYSFCAKDGCQDGEFPWSELIQATGGPLNGQLIGTASAGGIAAHGSGPGLGNVFAITRGGVLTTIYNFCAQPSCADGETPTAGVIQASGGYFYGATSQGGLDGVGTVFKVNSTGNLTTLKSLDNTDGAGISAALTQSRGGAFYGVTLFGGANSNSDFCAFTCGTIFKVSPSGVLSTLYNFCSQTNCVDGANPSGTLLQAANGDFYGTTSTGGANGGGTVFKLTPAGTLTTLYSFCKEENTDGICTDGESPAAGLIQATDGKLYGTTEFGGSKNWGTIFKISAGGTLTTLHNFNRTQGSAPVAALLQATDGNLYGTTSSDAFDNGTVFSLSVGLGPFVKTQTTSGAVGATVTILGTNLTGASGVTFNGTNAAFDFISKSEIKATVPTGASTGFVQVVTPSGTLTSNVVYTVK